MRARQGKAACSTVMPPVAEREVLKSPVILSAPEGEMSLCTEHWGKIRFPPASPAASLDQEPRLAPQPVFVNKGLLGEQEGEGSRRAGARREQGDEVKQPSGSVYFHSLQVTSK